MRLNHAALLLIVFAWAPVARSQDACCCYQFSGQDVFCQDCAYSFCSCVGGVCPSSDITCHTYKQPVEFDEGVSLIWLETFCEWNAACWYGGIGNCAPVTRECTKGTTYHTGVTYFPYAWEACPT